MKKPLKTQIRSFEKSLLFKIMKIQLFLIISIWGNLLYAENLFSQTTVNMNLEDVDIETLFSEIEKKTDFVIIYKESIPLKKKVSVNASNKSVQRILNEALTPLGLKYFINGKQIIIAENKAAASESVQKNQQQETKKNISGTVVDKLNFPLIGVSIMVKGTNTGTITDLNGRFTINNVDENSVLVFSFVGLISQEIIVSGKTVFNIVMHEDSQLMNEVVVVGFGSQKKINLTGAVAAIDSKVFESRPTTNAVQSLQGAVAGLQITTNSSGGQLDATQNIVIRGGKESGIGIGSGNPLILIDGMEGSLNTINPQDIDNISVLKDAAAAAIYGSRAPYGVILVTTKSGKAGKSVVNYNNNFRFNTPVHMPQQANSWEYVNFINDANYNGKGTAFYDDQHLQNIWDYMNGTLIDPATESFNPNYTMGVDPSGTGKWFTNTAWANSDWLKAYYNDWSKSEEHNLSISGGNDNISYYVSVNNQEQGGFLRYGDDNRQRYTLTGKLSAKASETFKVDFISRFIRIDYDKPARLTDSFFEEILRRSIPFHPIMSPDGLNEQGFIPVLKEGGRTDSQNEDLSLQLKTTYSPLKNLNIIGELNARIQNNWGHSHYFPAYSNYANDPERTYLNFLSEKSQYTYAVNSLGEPVGSVAESAARYTRLTPNFYVNYYFSVGNHSIAPMAGIQLETHKQRTLSARRYGLISEETHVIGKTTANLIDDISIDGSYGDWATFGLFGRINYDYNDRYLLEVNLRRDASSRYRERMRWVYSPSVSLGWNIAREDFFKPVERYIQYLKVRASYGTLANQNVSNFYPTYQDMNFSSGNGQWLINNVQPNTASAPGLVSALLTWEKVQTSNLGLDWGFFNNRFSGSFDVYNKYSIGLMGPVVELPAVLGTGAPDLNNTDLLTSGFEVEIRWKDRIKDFSYTIALNLSDDRAKVLKFPNPTGALNRAIEGELTGNIYGYTSIGIAKNHEEMLTHLESLRETRIELGLDLVGVDGLGGQSDGGLGRGLTAGDIMYKDINGDGLINTGSRTIHDMGDMSVIGNSRPRYQTSARIDLDWKGFDISIFWQGVLKRDHYPDANNNSGLSSGQDLNMIFWGATRGGVAFSTVFKEHLDYFRESEDHPLGQNLDAYYPKPIFNTRNQQIQTRYLQNAAYLRLKNLQIGYTLPAKWTKVVGIQRLRLFGTGENLLTFTQMSKLLDPEVAGYGAKGGVVYPLTKTYAFGVNVNF